MPQVEDSELIWIDLETTGLADDDFILEVGVIITDGDLCELDAMKKLVNNEVSISTLQSRCDPIVLEMHKNNGLWHDIEWENNTRPRGCETEILVFLNDWNIKPGTAPVAGSSIHFDRRLIRRDMPHLDTYCHYRNIDVSSIKELCRRWAPTVYNMRPGKEESDKKHRVLDDIRGSIEELKFYRQFFLQPEMVR